MTDSPAVRLFRLLFHSESHKAPGAGNENGRRRTGCTQREKPGLLSSERLRVPAEWIEPFGKRPVGLHKLPIGFIRHGDESDSIIFSVPAADQSLILETEVMNSDDLRMAGSTFQQNLLRLFPRMRRTPRISKNAEHSAHPVPDA